MALALAAAGCTVSTRQEVELGRRDAAEIERHMPLVHDPDALAYLSGLGGTLAGIADTRRLQWHFRLVDAMEVNAFALPGGFIYVNRGLVEHARTMAELAGVLGHEIGHVTERHSIRQMEKVRGAKAGLIAVCVLVRICDSGIGQAAISAVSGVTFAKFSRDDESAADREGIKVRHPRRDRSRRHSGDVRDIASGTTNASTRAPDVLSRTRSRKTAFAPPGR